MRVLGTDHIQRFDGSEWKTIESGAAFPESPDDGDFFQLTQGVPAMTTVGRRARRSTMGRTRS